MVSSGDGSIVVILALLHHIVFFIYLPSAVSSMKTTSMVDVSPSISQLAQRALDLSKKNRSIRQDLLQKPSTASNGDDEIKSSHNNDQVFIGISGGAGSGKTTIAQLVCDEINRQRRMESSSCDVDVAIVVPMDGYHYSKEEMREMAERGFKEPADSNDDEEDKFLTYDDMMTRRGAPWTFNAVALCNDLKAAKYLGEGQFPKYDRTISDPVPNGVVLTKGHEIVLCEGIYILALDSDDYRPLGEIFDDKWYIDVEREDTIMERLIERNLKNWTEQKQKSFGPGREGAMRKIETHDLVRSRWIKQHSMHHADLVIQNN